MSVAVFFDVDGTLTRTNILQPLLWYQRAHLSQVGFALWAFGLAWSLPRYWWIDQCDRSLVNELIYRRYAGLEARELQRWHRQTFADNLQRHLFDDAVSCVRQHQQAGRRVVLVTGGLDFVMAPLGEYLGADDVIATHLVEEAGILNGTIDGVALAAAHKAERADLYAQMHNIDLAQSYAYADSHADVPMLESVGCLVAVNPDNMLRTLAKARGWPIEVWR
ncbi:MAG TPA: HAD-IB family hydrolase [Gemmatales bacterium]|nr:HAD-IB family hydrolase [Gemmatales bacterium]